MNQLFLTSAIMGLIIIIFLMHRRFKFHKFSSKMYYFLWIIIAIRLILPFDISIKTPLYNFNNPIGTYEYVENDTNINENIVDVNADQNETIKPQLNNNPINRQDNIDIIDILNQSLFKVWLLGGILYLGYNLTIYYVFKFKLKRSLSFIDKAIEEKFNKIKLDMDINKKIDIKESILIDSPMVVRLIKPILVIPESIDLQNIEYIFIHELIHLKRRDIVYKSFIFAATAIHWFNPIVHMMSKIAGEDLELSCDEEVVKDMSRYEKVIYSKTLINAISKSKSPICTTNFSGGAKMIKKRLDKILDSLNKKSSKPLIIILIMSILGTGFLIGCNPTKEKTEVIDELYESRTEYVGDNSKVSNIVTKIEWPKDFLYESMQISTGSENNTLILTFNTDQDFTVDKFSVQSAILFSLIDNLDEVMYVQKNNEVERIIPLTREYIDNMTIAVLGIQTEYIGTSKKDFKKLVEDTKLVDITDKTGLKPTKHEVVNQIEGITMTRKEGTSDRQGVTLVFDNKSDIDYIYSEDFLIEKKIDGKWYELPVAIEEVFGFNDIGYTVDAGLSREFKLEWGWLYGELKPDKYRVIKSVKNLRGPGDFDKYYLSAEFHVY